jgi:hypothetical protein
VAASWNPKDGGGRINRLFGGHRTVLRGGYAMLYDRLNGVQKAIEPLQGMTFNQSLQCLGPDSAGHCLGSAGTTPATAFRIGVNGGSAPLPAFSAVSSTPLVPGSVAGANVAYAASNYQMDPHYTPGRNQEFDLTVQRELAANTLLEVGYIGHIARGIYSPLQANQVPYFMTAAGQTFAEAYDAIGTALRAGQSAASIAAQPFFESMLAGSSYCRGSNRSCTAGVIAKFSSSFTAENVFSLWNGIQPSFVTGQAHAATQQEGNLFFIAAKGESNYNAGFVSLRVRNWNGLSLDANLTYSHSLDNVGVTQDSDTAVINAFSLDNGYGTSVFDRKLVLNILGTYNLPFGKGTRFWDPIIRNWSVGPIVTWYGGLPLQVVVGSGQEFGQSSSRNASAVKINNRTVGNSVHSGVVAGNGVGTSGNSSSRGTSLNLFADPAAAFNSFREVLLGQDPQSNSNGGQLRGMAHKNVDVSLARTIDLEGRLGMTVSAQFFNAFNNVQFNDPTVSLESPQTFGVISSQMNNPRIIELGLRFHF